MLLLNRLYSYSPSKFYMLLKGFLPQNAEIEMQMELQKKSKNSVPDAVISQPSFKIVVETKLGGDFGISQLISHLEAFDGEKWVCVADVTDNFMRKKNHSFARMTAEKIRVTAFSTWGSKSARITEVRAALEEE